MNGRQAYHIHVLFQRHSFNSSRLHYCDQSSCHIRVQTCWKTMINGSVDAEKLRETPCDLEFFLHTKCLCALHSSSLFRILTNIKLTLRSKIDGYATEAFEWILTVFVIFLIYFRFMHCINMLRDRRRNCRSDRRGLRSHRVYQHYCFILMRLF